MRLSEDLSCRELVELVTDYFDGALSERDRERFEEHVVFCPGCASHLEQMRTTIAVTGALTEDDLPERTAAELLEAFRGWKRG
jgi:anti-sigma factor RsiW